MSEVHQWFHVYDPGLGGTCIIGTFATLEQAIKCANDSIENNWQPDHGDEWSMEVADIRVYRAPVWCDDPCEDEAPIVARAREVDIVRRPDDVDEDGFSEDSGDWWGHGYDYTCNYRVLPLEPAA